MSVTAHHSRVRLSRQQRPIRREACRWAEPQVLAGLYTALLDPDGVWTLHKGTSVLVASSDRNVLAAAMLSDAFEGHTIRPDLVAAFALELPDEGFVLPADLVAGWALRWALA